MIQWVYEAACRAPSLSRVIVATDSEQVVDAVRRFGGEAMMTDSALPSGTDRVAAIADSIPADIYVNIQGDEPLMDPRAIDAAVELVASGRFKMGTVMTALKTTEDLANRAVVKVIADREGRALYFSRLPIPYGRMAGPDSGQPFACFRHVGLYTYTRETLFRIRSLEPSVFEKAEMLEQLRAMGDGISIGITEVDFHSIGVDTPEELEKVREWLKRKSTSS